MHVVLGSGAVVKDLAPTDGLDFRDFADYCYESMTDFAWILAAFANGSDLRFFVFMCRFLANGWAWCRWCL